MTEEEQINELEPPKHPYFFPVVKHHENYLRTYGPKMKCFDENLEIHGNFNSEKAANLILVFEKCDRKLRDTCWKEEDIQDWLRGTYVVTLENTWTFR